MMIEINRNNIETWLLRYVDGELTPLEKMAVENYLVLNPDLAGELKALQQAQLPKEAVLFPFKSALLKRIQTEFSEEQLLDYIDGETDSFTTDAIREAVLDDAALVEQLNLLEQTKLPLENIEMPNKASLYRHEKQPVVVLWTRMMAAAVLLGLGILVWLLIPTNHHSTEVSNGVVAIQTPKTTDDAPALHEAQQQPLNATEKVAQQTVVMGNEKQNLSGKNILHQAVQKEDVTKTNVDEAVLPNNTVAIQPVNVNTGTVSVPEVNALLTEKETPNKIAPDKSVMAMKAVQAESDNTSNAKEVVYRVLDTDNDEGTPVYVNGLPLNKNKVNSLLQKAGGIFHALRSQQDLAKEKLTATAKLR
ncbi:anti-sigma factor family protein [Hydrotalea sandarakina]|jgi:hypothetical protein|uniref:Uncharacterized protein n=1 Tax=Hydrotalea sandarakina TaxID=1004304 RepID=A0A2W7SBB7_9BACT|nr:hypothetical protein [Hydrotalea sandarakina]PZX64389.1 hypothetical protein LX80_00585 [Hydrotalea sandarakina]